MQTRYTVEAAEELHCDNLLVITANQDAQTEWKGKTSSAICVLDDAELVPNVEINIAEILCHKNITIKQN